MERANAGACCIIPTCLLVARGEQQLAENEVPSLSVIGSGLRTAERARILVSQDATVIHDAVVDVQRHSSSAR